MSDKKYNNIELNNNSFVPLYQQLYSNIKKQITCGIYKPGDKLPSEHQLCKEFNVSRITVRAALHELVNDEILYKKRGKGTYIKFPEIIEASRAGNSFTNSCNYINAKPNTRIISTTIEKANKTIAKALNIDINDNVICINRLRLIDDCPVIFEIDYFRSEYTFLLDQDLEDKSLMNIISNNIHTLPKYADSIFEIEYSNKNFSEHLKCTSNMPLLKVKQSIYTSDNEILYYNIQYIKSTEYKYAISSNI